MTPAERIAATLARQPVDRPPVAFWRHAPDVDHTARGLAEAMLAFHRRFRLDLIKIMSSGVYCVEDWGCEVAYTGAPTGAKQCTRHAVQAPGDWARLRPLDPGAGALGRELEALRLIRAGRDDDAPALHTIFSPLTVAAKLAGPERLREHLRADPAPVLAGLEVITETLARYARAALDAGADGIFFATQTGSAEMFRQEENARWGAPYARRVLEPIAARARLVLLHIHGRDIYFDQLATLPVHAINWHDRLTPPSLSGGLARSRGAVVGGLAEWTTLRTGTAADAAREAEDAIRATGGRGLIVAPGCVLPLDTPETTLDAVVRAVARSRP